MNPDPPDEDPMPFLLALIVGIFLLLAGCSAPCPTPPPVGPCGHIGPGLTYRGIGHDGKPACQACGAGKCG